MTQVTVPVNLGGDGLPFSDDGSSARDMQGQGYATNFFPMVNQVVAANAIAVQAAGAIATGSTNTNSTTSLVIGTVPQTLTVETGKALVPGMWILLAYRSDPSKNMTGQVTSYDAGTGALVLNVTALSGSGTYADWVGSVTGAPALTGIARADKTSAYTLAGTDKGALIDCTGTWTLGFDAAATLGAGWWCYVRNIGTGTITADPNGSELIDGVTSGAIRPGMTLLVQCDGTAFHCVRVGPMVASELRTTGTSWVCPLGVRRARVRGAAGGGGGKAYGSDGVMGGSGGGGGYFEGFAAVTPGTSYAYAIGAAGAANTSGGGNTTFTADNGTFTANGGSIGANFVGGAGGGASGPDSAVAITGGKGFGSATASTVSGARGIGGSTPLARFGVGGGGGGLSAEGGYQGALVLEY